MSDARVVIGDSAARWNSTSALYGESLCDPLASRGGPAIGISHVAAILGLEVARAYVVTMHGSEMIDASRHDL